MRTSVRACLLLLLLLTARAAQAHDVLASTTNLWVRTTGMDAEVYLARAAGGLLIARNGETITIFEDNFSQYRERLQAVATELLQLTAGDGTVMKPDRVLVSMTDENDLRYDLHYPLPAAMPGTLKIHASYLDKMAEGHVGNIYVMNSKGDDFGWKEVTVEEKDLVAKLPAAASLPALKVADVPGTSPGGSLSTGASEVRGSSFPGGMMVVILGGGVVMMVLAYLFLRNKNNRRL